ncbi:MAG: endonuclease/exonuclease/phosphatase family protein [Gammaproteobacteria bacterium]|nr:endonuclease/exonuclease/phosphatase family protein [Gammaproteobacteria bacterium]
MAACAVGAGKSAYAEDVTVRFATFNASLNRNSLGELAADLDLPSALSVDLTQRYANSADVSGLSSSQREVLQIHNVAEILQKINADVLLVNEFDYDEYGVAGTSSSSQPLGYSSLSAQRFQSNYLSVVHGGADTGRDATSPLYYQYAYTPATNTGLASGLDLDNNGTIGGGNDAFGFGNFAGQYGFTLYSKYEITAVRTFQTFLWKDMPDNLLTSDPSPDATNLANYYSADEIEQLRLSSKNHVDITVNIDGQEVHFLAAHPTPPVFDGVEDRNGKRNADEIRFWADYINGGDQAAYIYDDNGLAGGLAAGSIFVIAGDYNADPNDGDSFANAISQLLSDPLINVSFTPESPGGTLAAVDPDNNGNTNASHIGDPRFDTGDFNDAAPGNLRVDYVLPSSNVDMLGGGVFWPTEADADRPLVGEFGQPGLFSGMPSSDHKAVFVDVAIPQPVPVPAALPLLASALGLLSARRRCRRA